MGFRLQAFHLLWSGFPSASPNRCTATTGSYDPREQAPGFGLFRFRSPLLTESHSISFPPLTEMFHFSGCCVLRSMRFNRRRSGINRNGLPHSEIRGSGPICGSPRLIAAYHVLLRLLAPRHPSCALSSFIFFDIWKSLICAITVSAVGGAMIAQTQQIVEVAFNLPCMRMSKNLPWDGPAAADACPVSDRRQNSKRFSDFQLSVGLIGLEPMTLRLSSACSNQLSYRPIVG